MTGAASLAALVVLAGSGNLSSDDLQKAGFERVFHAECSVRDGSMGCLDGYRKGRRTYLCESYYSKREPERNFDRCREAKLPLSD